MRTGTRLILYGILVVLTGLTFYGFWVRSDPNHEINLLAKAYAKDPNVIRQIIFPKNTKLPNRYKCPIHGVTEKILIFEIDGDKSKYCKVCAMRFIVALLDLNLPKLEIINENAETKDETMEKPTLGDTQ